MASNLGYRLVAILAADGVEYSRLMARDAGDISRNSMLHVPSSHRTWRCIGANADTAGDSILAVFGTASGAVQAALVIQRDLATSAVGRPRERVLRYRIGIHLGDVIEKSDGSVYGNGVNVAARVQALAKPGAIAVSDILRGALGEACPHPCALTIKACIRCATSRNRCTCSACRSSRAAVAADPLTMARRMAGMCWSRVVIG